MEDGRKGESFSIMRVVDRVVVAALCLFAVPSGPAAQNKTPPPNKELEALQAHFETVIARRHDQLFSGVTTVQQWEARRKQSRAALAKMLWHDMRWPDAPPPATVTDRQDHPGYTIENVVLETAPQVYLTANLYLPRSGTGPFPVVLYQCGHASKSVYRRHGAWFAANGIAALVMDNIEMGEIEFTHHGVYSRAWFHWYSRGFSPLAVELLNARRAIDYLAARPDIDRRRIGATGRSGGGMTTFFLAALDDRIVASAPVSGTLSTMGWVKQRLSMAHCDCQYPINSYGLLYSEVGAMIAPRPQLLVNADADRGFPMDAFTEMVDKVREIYRLYDRTAALATAVTPGGHSDTEAIRVPVYSFFLHEFLGRQDPVTAEGPVDEPLPEELMCFRNGLPMDERLTRIDEELFSTRLGLRSPSAAGPSPSSVDQLRQALRSEVFRYFPDKPSALQPEWGDESILQGRRLRTVSFTSFEGLRARATYSVPADAAAETRLPAVLLVDHRKGIPVWGNEQPLERNQWGNRAVLIVQTLDRGSRALEQNLRSFTDDDLLHHMKRQAMVAGTTLESMQVYEILRSLNLLRTLPSVDQSAITILGKGEDGVNGMYAALLDGAVRRAVLQSPPASHLHGPHYLGVLRYTDIAATAALLSKKVLVYGEVPDALRSLKACATMENCLQ
jgi:cephalosporin-C deacetylase-like acetyl esterase